MTKPAGEIPAVLKLPADATCRRCGYSLHNLTQPRCPECGGDFNPREPESYCAPSQRALLIEIARHKRLEMRAVPLSAAKRTMASVCLVFALLSLGCVPKPLGVLFLANWIVLASISLGELSRWQARKRLAMAPQPKPPLGRYGWKVLAISFLALAAPIPMALLFIAHLPLFNSQVREIQAASFHEHPSPRYLGLMWIEVDRCPHAIYFISPQHGNPLSNHVTLVHRTSTGSCQHAHGIPIWKGWQVRPGMGRGRDPSQL